jgi:hypothetical protein
MELPVMGPLSVAYATFEHFEYLFALHQPLKVHNTSRGVFKTAGGCWAQ